MKRGLATLFGGLSAGAILGGLVVGTQWAVRTVGVELTAVPYVIMFIALLCRPRANQDPEGTLRATLARLDPTRRAQAFAVLFGVLGILQGGHSPNGRENAILVWASVPMSIALCVALWTLPFRVSPASADLPWFRRLGATDILGLLVGVIGWSYWAAVR